jgi:hypothetical protein
MLTPEDWDEIKQLIGAMIAEAQGGADLAALASHPLVDVLARAIEVFGEREKALQWLRTPVRSLGDKTPISLLGTPEGLARVLDTLGRVEHGVW